jgi:hypothetical protein
MQPQDLSEVQIQAAIVEWLNRCLRCRVAAIPNGTSTTPYGAMRARKEGLSKGAPDLVVAYVQDGEPRTLWIECKSRTGRLSEDQLRWRDDLQALGHDWLLARSLDDVVNWFGDAP